MKLFKNKLALILIGPIVAVLGLAAIIALFFETKGAGVILFIFLLSGLFAFSNMLYHLKSKDVTIK